MTGEQHYCAPPVQVFPGVVIVSGPALKDLYFLVSSGVRAASRNGKVDNRFEGLRRAIRDADVARTRQRDTGSEADCADCAGDDELAVDQIGTAEAALILGISLRSCQRKAKGLGRKVAGRWVFDRQLVVAEAAHRKSA